ncbi:hypothetical protein PH242_11905 [Photorhabdus bodei]|uniref:hypothetical protein n=1 Tax=Photorhabdus bodei TaxID=2029681 RepID=UPI002330C23E|nr:hypothetical protein [Photorhabdus bodei]MDB6368361.1 hypothetical protein [Photorhabdus bodei]
MWLLLVEKLFGNIYTLWISRCIAAARERIPGSIDNYVTGVSECSQQRGNLKDDGYRSYLTSNPFGNVRESGWLYG